VIEGETSDLLGAHHGKRLVIVVVRTSNSNSTTIEVNMGIPVQISDGDRIASIDKNTNTLQTIAYYHHEIHSGSAYRVWAQESVTANATHTIALLTPNSTKRIHLESRVSTANSSALYLYEMPNAPTANGTPRTPRNANRNYADNSSVQFVFEDSTLNLTANITLAHAHIGSTGARPNDPSFGGASESRKEWVLKQNTWYALQVTDASESAQEMSIVLDWYEHTPKTV